MNDYIICYDIADPRRLNRIHRALKKLAVPVQYSLFLFCGNEVHLQHCLEHLQQLMNPQEDDIRAYPLPRRGLRMVLGAPVLPEGIQLGWLHSDWLWKAP